MVVRALDELLARNGDQPALTGRWQRLGGRLDRLANGLLQRLEAGRESPVLAALVPGRIELVGKHTDYAGGRSLVAAIERGIWLLAAPTGDRSMVIWRVGANEPISFTIEPGLETRVADWTLYPRTVARRLARDFPDIGKGARIAFDSDLPPAAGLSSSSALVVACFLVLARFNDLYRRRTFRAEIDTCEERAAYLAAVENGEAYGSLRGDRGVGTHGGSQDHAAILCSRAGEVRQYRFAPLGLERVVSMPSDYLFAVAVSGVEADKTGGARSLYNRAVRAASVVARVWRRHTGGEHRHLGAILAGEPRADEELQELLPVTNDPEFTGQELLDRWRQFREETVRIVPAAADALARRDWRELGRVVDRSQKLAEHRLGNQVPETAMLAAEARRLGAVAASAFGAGFGGSVWALVERSGAGEFLGRWSRRYLDVFPQHGARTEFFLSEAASAATES